MKKNLLILALSIGTFSFVQNKVEEVTIKTSSECNMCKERIEEKLNYTKGVTFVNLEVSTKLLNVKFKPEKITLVKIKEIISNLGYDADEIKANLESQNKLPKCCKPNGMK